MTYPIAGNQNFTKVENLAGQLNTLNVNDITVNDIQVEGKIVGDVSTNGHVITHSLITVPRNTELVKLTLFTPENNTTWRTAGNAPVPLVAVDPSNTTPFKFGVDSVVVGASVRTSEALLSQGSATINVGRSAGSPTDLLNGVFLSNLELVGDQVDVSNGVGGPATNLGQNGEVSGVAVSGSEQVNVSVASADLTQGQLEVDVYFYVN